MDSEDTKIHAANVTQGSLQVKFGPTTLPQTEATTNLLHTKSLSVLREGDTGGMCCSTAAAAADNNFHSSCGEASLQVPQVRRRSPHPAVVAGGAQAGASDAPCLTNDGQFHSAAH